MGIIILISFFTLMVLGVPIAFALGGAGILGLTLVPEAAGMIDAVPQQIFNSLNSFPFLTIPLFIFAGTIMAEGGVAQRLMAITGLTVGRGRGGLGVAVVIAAIFFHGISGSSTADTAAIGKVTLPALRKQGYPLPFGTALLAAAGATATLVPPTIDLIIIGVVANMSIAGLFAAGLIPALINGAGLILVVVVLSRRHGWGGGAQKVTLREAVITFIKAIPALFMIVIILGGILSGAFTPTEASAVAVVYGLFVAIFVYRDLKLAMLPRVFRETIEISGMVMLVISMGALLGFGMTIGQVPQSVAVSLQQFGDSRALFLLLVQLLFFAIGMFMDAVPALIILMPILTPVAISHGIDPIHFGILVEANVALGMAHPPVGVCVFAACAVSKLPIERVIRPLLPFIAILIVTLMVITYVEGFSMFLPRLLGLTE
jgi:tripartite ATP-independent transporter DctM subunit